MSRSRIALWLFKRLDIEDELGKLLYKPLKGGAKYIFSLGFINLFLFVNQVLTGMFLMVYYVPSPDHAYDSVKYIQYEVPFGYMVRGLHYWGATAMVVSVMAHVARVFVFGAYKKPREPMWLTGVVIFFVVFGFAFTGYLLPWDQKSYWATVVGTNIPGTAPVLGNFIMRLFRGGTDVSAITLTRFFSVHTMLLPWLLAAFAGMHLVILQLVDHTPPWDPVKARRESPFFPDQVFKDAVMMFLVFAVMAFLATVSPAKLEALADPTDHNYNPRPEWYFYFLFQLLHYTEGKYEMVGTFLIPNAFVAAMLLPGAYLIPRFWDRIETFRQFKPARHSELLKEPGFRGRLSENLVAVRMFGDHPIIGSGIGNYRPLYQQYARPLGIDPRTIPRRAHNMYLETAAETGLVGAVLLLLLSANVALNCPWPLSTACAC